MGEREKAYRRRIRAWTLYDWANSAFATTILAAVLPVYYRQVAGSTLPGPSVATAFWTTGLSLSIFLGGAAGPGAGHPVRPPPREEALPGAVRRAGGDRARTCWCW